MFIKIQVYKLEKGENNVKLRKVQRRNWKEKIKNIY